MTIGVRYLVQVREGGWWITMATEVSLGAAFLWSESLRLHDEVRIVRELWNGAGPERHVLDRLEEQRRPPKRAKRRTVH